MHHPPPLMPPFRFSCIEDNIYRGGYPTLRNFRFLKRLKLKCIVSILPEAPTSDLADFCHDEGIRNVHIAAPKFTFDNVTVSKASVVQIIELMLNTSDNLPMYIHCLDGGNVTGIVVMVLRKLQHFTASKIVAEFCRFSTDNAIEKEEQEYVATFHEEVEIPQPNDKIPSWLWHSIVPIKHPTMKIRYAACTEMSEENKPTMLSEVALTRERSQPISATVYNNASSRSFASSGRQLGGEVGSTTAESFSVFDQHVVLVQDRNTGATAADSESPSRLMQALDIAGIQFRKIRNGGHRRK